MNYSLTTQKTWDATYRDLRETFSKWGVEDWNVARDEARATNTGVTVTYTPVRGRQEIRLHKSNLGRAVDNFRALYLGIEAIRMNEKRGIGDVIAQHYQALAAPASARDPYEVLGVRSSEPLEDIEAIYRSKAKRAHPDAGGNEAAMKELNEAIERVRVEKGAKA